MSRHQIDPGKMPSETSILNADFRDNRQSYPLVYGVAKKF